MAGKNDSNLRKPIIASEKSQSARFIEAAKKVGADESGKAFEKALGKILIEKKSAKRTKVADR